MTLKIFKAVPLIAFTGCLLPAHAQGIKAPDLDGILQRLEENLEHYDAGIPSLFCDEHAISSEMDHTQPDQITATDSVFRLRRVLKADHTITLLESREIKRVNGTPASPQNIDGPALLSGLFEGGLSVVSLSQVSCMDYSLQRIKKKHRAEPYTVHFATATAPQNSTYCFLQEESTGRAFIDPASMQVTQLEIETPRHVMFSGAPFFSRAVGKRKLTVNYAPVLLGEATFWMPSAISMRITSGNGFKETRWAFQATYRNYHREEVTSRVLPALETHAP